MRCSKTAFAVLLTVATALAAPALAVSVPQSGAAGPDARLQEAPPTPAADDAPMGATISSFMQAHAAEAEGEVENRMFAAKFNDTAAERRPELVTQRVSALRSRANELAERRDELLSAADGEVNVSERARAAHLAARIRGLQRAIDLTERAAVRAGVNVTALDELRLNARNLSGPEVAAMAGKIAGKPDHPGARNRGNGSRLDGGSGASDDGESPGRSGDARNRSADGRSNAGSDGGVPPGERGGAGERGNQNNASDDSVARDA